MLHRHGVALFAFQSLLCSFDALAHSCASHPLSCKWVPILGCPWWLLLSLFIKLDNAPKCSVAWFIITKLNKSFIFLKELFSDWLCASCQHPSRLSISYELDFSWNIPFKYMRSSTFMELSCHSDLHFILCSTSFPPVAFHTLQYIFPASGLLWKKYSISSKRFFLDLSVVVFKGYTFIHSWWDKRQYFKRVS